MAFWTGLMEIAQRGGLIRALTGRMAPVLKFLFPGLPVGHPAREHIATNFIANVLGLGWAATPAGLRAMEELGKLEEDRRAGRAAGPARKRGIASNEMCTFLIINISSLQLIPVNVIAYRSQYGSVNPAAIVGAGDPGHIGEHRGGDPVLQGDGEKKEGLTPSSYLILFCSFFFLPAKQRPHSQQHGDEAGRAAHKVEMGSARNTPSVPSPPTAGRIRVSGITMITFRNREKKTACLERPRATAVDWPANCRDIMKMPAK